MDGHKGASALKENKGKKRKQEGAKGQFKRKRQRTSRKD
jgi:hypothetical protein